METTKERKAEEGGQQNEAEGEKPNVRHKGKRKAEEDPLAPTTQGALLLQSMLRLSEPHNDAVLNRSACKSSYSMVNVPNTYRCRFSLASLSLEDVMALAHHPTSSRVLDVVLESPTVPPRARRRLITSFIGHFHTLVDDRIGSRVGDRCWDTADPYLRVRYPPSLFRPPIY